MKKYTFQDYLYDKHASQYTGLDDDMPDDYADWESDLDPIQLIEWADKWREIANKKEGLT